MSRLIDEVECCSFEAERISNSAKKNQFKTSNMHIVYILISSKDPNRCYIGLTQDLQKRLREHNASEGGYSKKYAPWKVETYITFNNKDLAEQFEKYLKAGSGQAFLKKRLIYKIGTTSHLERK